jgi:O-methyltransferase.
VLKQVLHDWDDPRAAAILKTRRRVMKPGAKLLVVELLVPETGPAVLFASLIDLQMLVVQGGRERTKEEFTHLLRAAGYELQRVIITSTPCRILGAMPI